MQLDAAVPRKTAYGEPACERCCRQLARVPHHRAHGAGRACHPRCKPPKRAVEDNAEHGAAASAASVQGPVPKRQWLRAQSNTGQQIDDTATASRLRVRKRVQAPPAVDLVALLDKTHARRLAFLRVAANEFQSDEG
jgi:hypothetical protein